jgi:acetyl esterase/lipase
MPRHAAAARRLAWAVLLLAAPASFAAKKDPAVVYLTDGHVLRGYVLQPTETIIDPVSQAPITLHKGIFLVDDFCRRYYFSHAYVDRAETRDFDVGKQIKWDFPRSFPDGKSLPPIREILEAGAWDDQWNRRYRFRAPDGTVTLWQHVSILSPYLTRVDAHCLDPATRKKSNPYPWTSLYPTRELGPKTVLSLLSTHADFKDKPDLTDDQRADRRFQIFNFLVQAGWLDEAEKELERIRRDFPKAKEKAETAAEGIKKLVALDRLDEIKAAYAAGRHEAAQRLLAAFPTASADDQTQAEVRSLKAKYELAGTSLRRAEEFLTKLPRELPDGADKNLYTAAAAAIAGELTLDHFFKKGENDDVRLDRFLNQAEQAERLATQKMPHLSPEELLSLAVTSWLTGSATGETKPPAAQRLWRARQFLMEYRKTDDPAARAAQLKAYESQAAPGVSEIAQLISTLPPPARPQTFTRGPAEGAAYYAAHACGAQALAPAGASLGAVAQLLAASEVAALRASSLDRVEMSAPAAFGGRPVTYTLQLPPEYHPGRAYPVLVALHNGGETAKNMMDRLAESAAKHGYILAAPDWDFARGGTYLYSAEEHAAVLDTLRDLGRHFNVDTDRVFLTGYGEGGNMAWDVGLSHPDLFAGVVPVNGQPRYHARAYWPNAMVLPFYVVWGEYMGGPTRTPDKRTNGNLVTYELFKDHWIPGGFPALGVQYKGRGLEWFPAEVPTIFEWMAQKRRQNPMAKIGFKNRASSEPEPGEYEAHQCTMRPGDNHFYWLSVDGLAPQRLNESARWWNPNAKVATVAGRIVNGNQVGVFAAGVKQVTVWLGRGTVDFEKPVTVYLNSSQLGNPRPVKPSLAVLLEDFYQRGDRQRLYVARIDLTLGKK